MKTILFILLATLASFHGHGQKEVVIATLEKEAILKEYNKRNIPDTLIDSCNKIWNINHSIWFKNWKRGYPLVVDGDYSKNVRIAFRTKNYVIVFYHNNLGRAHAPTILILSQDLKQLYRLSMSYYPAPKSAMAVLEYLKMGKFELK